MVQKSEEKIQQEIVMWFRNNYCLKHHTPVREIISIPNVGVAGARHQMMQVSTGLRKGASDLMVFFENLVVFVEVKTPTGKQSTAQSEFQKKIERLGFRYFLVHSLDEFKSVVNTCFDLENEISFSKR